MVEAKIYRSPEGNYSKKSTEEDKGQASNHKRYKCEKARTKNQGTEIEAGTNFKGRYRDLEGYIFDLGTRALD